MRVHQCEGGIVADRADVAEMIGKPLELRQQSAQPNRAIRYDKLQRRFGRSRKCKSIGDGAVARRAPGELDSALKIGSDHESLNTLVGISEPLFQSDYGLPA